MLDFDYLSIFFRIAGWTTAGKELTLWRFMLSELFVFLSHIVWGKLWNSTASVPDHCLFSFLDLSG